MTARVTGPDETFMTVEAVAGVETPIQMGWVFAHDPGEAAVDVVHARLAAGPVNRAVRRTRVPFARHRWVPCDHVDVARHDREPVAAGAVSQWFTDHLESTPVRPTAGRSWHVASAPTTDGGRVVSVLASHVVCDGSGLRAAVLGTTPAAAADPPTTRVVDELLDDLRDAVAQVRSALRSILVMLRLTVAGGRRDRSDADNGAPAVVDVGPTHRRTVPTPVAANGVPEEPPVRHVLVTLDSAQVAARAADRGGTPNSLFCALLGGVAQRAHIPESDTTAICIAVDRREGDHDGRANASGGVWIRVRGALDGPVDLSGIRARTKSALTTYSAHGADASADNVQPIVRLLPARLVLLLMRLIPSPHTTVSNLGDVGEDLLRMGEQRAHVQFTRAAVRGLGADARRRLCRPGLLAWLTVHGEHATLAVCGVDPDRFGGDGVLRSLVVDELDAWGLSHAVV
ncbi:hypothetical protein LX14_003932 [Williamsia deligens]|nr:hypothetical protein [Williamsia deligens]